MKSRALKGEAMGILFILPAFLCLLVFVLIPIVRSVYLSFFSWDMITSDPVFLGLRNFKDLFADATFFKALKQTFVYCILIIPVSMAGGLIAALCMAEERRVNVLFRSIFFSPRVTSMVAISAVWIYILHPQIGILNRVLGVFGVTPPIRWLNDTKTAIIGVALVAIWKSLAYCTILYLGGVQNVPREVMEAATVDGANALQKVWHIQLPLVSPTSFMLMILVTIDTLKMFTSINVMTGGGPAKSTMNLTTMLYGRAFGSFEFGYASAIGVILFAIILIVNAIQMRLEKYVNYD